MITRFLIYGMVQGVGFRWFVARHARALGFQGYARNLPDGSVEVVVGGRDDSLPELERLLQTGPSHARVERVERSREPAPSPVGHSFDIL